MRNKGWGLWLGLLAVVWLVLAIPTLIFSLDGNGIAPILWIGWLQVVTAGLAFAFIIVNLIKTQKALEIQQTLLEQANRPSGLRLSILNYAMLSEGQWIVNVTATPGVGPIKEFNLFLFFVESESTIKYCKIDLSTGEWGTIGELPSPYRIRENYKCTLHPGSEQQIGMLWITPPNEIKIVTTISVPGAGSDTQVLILNSPADGEVYVYFPSENLT